MNSNIKTTKFGVKKLDTSLCRTVQTVQRISLHWTM